MPCSSCNQNYFHHHRWQAFCDWEGERAGSSVAQVRSACPAFSFLHKTCWATATYRIHRRLWWGANHGSWSFGKLALKSSTWQTQTFRFPQDFWNRMGDISVLRPTRNRRITCKMILLASLIFQHGPGLRNVLALAGPSLAKPRGRLRHLPRQSHVSTVPSEKEKRLACLMKVGASLMGQDSCIRCDIHHNQVFLGQAFGKLDDSQPVPSLCFCSYGHGFRNHVLWI